MLTSNILMHVFPFVFLLSILPCCHILFMATVFINFNHMYIYTYLHVYVYIYIVLLVADMFSTFNICI